MNNSKWIRLFKVLSTINTKVNSCLLYSIYNDQRAINLEIPSEAEFNSTFYSSGIRDVIIAGTILFKEIRFLEICYDKNIDEINALITNLGKLEIERTETCLKIYAYR